MSRKVVKPKRPARKRTSLEAMREMAKGHILEIARVDIENQKLTRQLFAAEADKRGLLDELFQLKRDHWFLAENATLENGNLNLMLDALCHGFEHVQEYHVAEQRNSRQWKIEHDAVRAERDALAKRNQELEAELKQRVEWIERDLGKAEHTERRNLPPIETKCQMEIEKW